jgi:hypothetical protein
MEWMDAARRSKATKHSLSGRPMSSKIERGKLWRKMRRAGRAKSKSPIPPAWRIKSFCGGVTELSGEVLKLGIYQLFFSYRFKDSASGANGLVLVLKSWQEVFPA